MNIIECLNTDVLTRLQTSNTISTYIFVTIIYTSVWRGGGWENYFNVY